MCVKYKEDNTAVDIRKNRMKKVILMIYQNVYLCIIWLKLNKCKRLITTCEIGLLQMSQRNSAQPMWITTFYSSLAISIRAQPDTEPLQATVAEQST